MKKVISSAAIVLLALAMVPSIASAKDKTGAFGIGADSSLGAVSGISARYQVAKSFGIQAILGFDTVNYNNDESGNTEVDASATQIRAAIRGDIGLAFTKKTNLNLIVGIDVYNSSTDVTVAGTSNDDSQTQFAFELGLGAHYFFTDWFSVNGEVGLAFATISSTDDIGTLSDIGGSGGFMGGGDDGKNASGYELAFGRGDTFGSFGWTFWFN
jgi:opacity protein-like surface antigen